MNGMKRGSKKRSKQVIKAGDAVLLRFGDRDVRAVVLEDRGLIGRTGQRRFLIQFHLAYVTPDEVTEVSADRIRPDPRAKRRKTQRAEGPAAEA